MNPYPKLQPLKQAERDHKVDSLTQSERRVISCLISDGGFLPEARAEHAEKVKAEGLQAQDFYSQAHGLVFRVALRLHKQGRPSDTGALLTELNADELAQIGGFQGLLRMADAAPTSIYLSGDIAAIKAAAKRRKINDLARRIVDAGTDDQTAARLIRQAAELAEQKSMTAEVSPWGLRKFSDMVTDVKAAPAELISDMLYSGGTMMMAGASKSMKSYSMIALGLAVAAGDKWLGFNCAPAPVIFLNLELQPFAMEKRVREVAAAMRIDPPDTFMVIHLRGVLVSVDAMEKQLGALLKEHKPGLTILDPHYKISAASGVEENSNDGQGLLLYRLENLICGNGSALCISHHFSKGDKSQTKAMDRAAGGGVLARWGDVMMSITDHEEEGCAVAEFSLRNFRPINPFGLRWQYPVWSRDPRLDPAKLRKPGRPSTGGPEDIIQFVQKSGSSRMDVVNAAMAAGKGGKSTVQSKIKTLLDAGKLREMSGILFHD